MHARLKACLTALVFFPLSLPVLADGETVAGDRLDASAIGELVVESMTAVIARAPYVTEKLPPARRGENGDWIVPTMSSMSSARAGEKHILNEWGDTRMAVGFGRLVDLRGALIGADSADAPWTTAVRAIGYRNGVEVAKTEWFGDITSESTWFAIGFEQIDRVAFEAVPVANGGGWYALDNLTYALRDDAGVETDLVVLDFEDLDYRTNLTEVGYRGLTWERGTGDFEQKAIIHAPQKPDGVADVRGESEPTPDQLRDGEPESTAPAFLGQVQGVTGFDIGTSAPPDTCGALGPNHAVIVVNSNFSVYNRATGARVINTSLTAFQPGTSGDPRVVYDQLAGRWIVLSTNFSGGRQIFVAVSTTSDPTGNWFKFNFNTAQGSDANKWPDYPTLGYDQNGIYTGAYMVGGTNRMTLFAIDKAPLIATPQALGTITAFRELPWEGALQPAMTYGTPPGAYVSSVSGSTQIRVRRVNPPLTSPTLTQIGFVNVPFFADPPDAPALGSTVALDTVGTRLMMAVFRNNAIYTSHCISVSGRAAARWYQFNPETLSLIQSGTVSDSSLYYFFPSIMVNSAGHLTMGFTGSNASQYAGAYYTGRLVTDPPGSMATPVQYRAGLSAQNVIDGVGRNRWGDYSLTTLDPVGGIETWSLQEYAHTGGAWGTTFARLSLGGDCNNNGVPDNQDIASGTSLDCNDNNNPDECDISLGVIGDCNNNNIPDDCDIASGVALDCNNNLVPDQCDLSGGTSPDCNNNSIPDECDLAGGAPDCNVNGVPDSCDIASGAAPDCNSNGVPDVCDLATGAAQDCNGNAVPDTCDVATTYSGDCNGNGLPDECDISATFVSVDCNENLLPDECEVDSRQGLAGAYYGQPNFGGAPRGELDATVDLNFGAGAPLPSLPADNFSIRWTGWLRTPASAGTYTFYVLSDDGARLRVDNQLIVNQFVSQPPTEHSGSLALQANRWYAISLEYFSATGDAQVRLSWQPPGGAKAVIPAANLAPGRDCNNNGRNDYCDFVGEFNVQSSNQTPFGTPGVNTFVFPTPPDASADVTVQVIVQGDINTSNETVAVTLNGSAIGTAYTEGGFIDCTPDSLDTLVVPAATFNAWKGAGDVTIACTPSPQVNAAACGGDTTIRVGLVYDRLLSADANNNLIPDECEGPSICPGDVNCDGAVNFGDIDRFVEALGFPGGAGWPYPCPWLAGDTNNDGVVNFTDIDPFVALIGTNCP